MRESLLSILLRDHMACSIQMTPSRVFAKSGKLYVQQQLSHSWRLYCVMSRIWLLIFRKSWSVGAGDLISSNRTGESMVLHKERIQAVVETWQARCSDAWGGRAYNLAEWTWNAQGQHVILSIFVLVSERFTTEALMILLSQSTLCCSD